MRLSFIFLFSFLVIQYSFSQINDNATFLTIENQNVSVGDFERIYNKNNSISSSDKQSIDEYLPMFVNFKLKVQAAMDGGYDTLTSFKTELKGYRDQLAKSYLTDNSAVDSLVKEAYQRMHTEVNASHIMVSLKINATPEDTLIAWNKIMAIRQRILKGESFEKLAFELSEDPSAKNNKGNLGYFSAFQMVYPFESTVYNNKIGEISMPVRSKFGYHLIKTNDKRPARGEVKVAHIMLMVPQGSSDSVWISTQKKINEIAQQLKSGADFATLAKDRSEDRGSARNGGELPAFGAGRMVAEFDEAAFKLQSPGDVSEPIKTFYGWHIIKLIEKTGIPEFEKIKQELKSRISRDERAEAGSNSFIAKLKKEYRFTENQSLLSELIQKPQQPKTNVKGKKQNITNIPVQSPKLNLNVDNSIASQELFMFSDQKYQLSQFIDFLKTLPTPDNTVIIDNFIKANYASYVKNAMLSYEDSRLETKYPDFRNLVQEYHDGILLFNLSDSIIWSKAAKDSVGLQKFYDENKASYVWPERLEATIISSRSEATIEKALKAVKKFKTQTSIEQGLVKAVCDTSSKEPCIEISYGKFSKGENPITDTILWKKGISTKMERNGSFCFVVVHSLLQPMPKLLDEARGLIISDYQNYLDNEWIKTLRSQHSVNINNEVLNQLKNKYESRN